MRTLTGASLTAAFILDKSYLYNKKVTFFIQSRRNIRSEKCHTGSFAEKRDALRFSVCDSLSIKCVRYKWLSISACRTVLPWSIVHSCISLNSLFLHFIISRHAHDSSAPFSRLDKTLKSPHLSCRPSRSQALNDDTICSVYIRTVQTMGLYERARRHRVIGLNKCRKKSSRRFTYPWWVNPDDEDGENVSRRGVIRKNVTRAHTHTFIYS